MTEKPRIIIVYRVSSRSKKHQLMILENTNVDDILSTTKRKPVIPNEWELDEICVGYSESTINSYKKKYKIK